MLSETILKNPNRRFKMKLAKKTKMRNSKQTFFFAMLMFLGVVTFQTPTSAETKTTVLAVGVESVSYGERLRHARSDCRQIAVAFDSLGAKTTTMTDAPKTNPKNIPNRKNILTIWDRMCCDALPDDLLIFYANTHGVSIGGESFIVPVGILLALEFSVL
jgi:hypothetical protein